MLENLMMLTETVRTLRLQDLLLAQIDALAHVSSVSPFVLPLPLPPLLPRRLRDVDVSCLLL